MRGLDIRLDAVSMRFGAFTAVQPTNLAVSAGEFFSILGPSGCGKTTLLRLIAGFETPTTGVIGIGGEAMTRVPPNRRPTSLVFQNLALFPLMSVRENVAFGLEARKVARPERSRRADELLDLVALTGQGDKIPGQLSGGQRQRVAIARALAVEPGVLLLDEPLSALDLKLRQHMRAELRAIQKRTGVTFLYITHDQGEALAMSDRVAVMDHGRVEQVGSPQDIYAEPCSLFVARFVGEQNEFPGRIMATDGRAVRVQTPLGQLGGRLANGPAPEGAVTVCIRPERVRLDGVGGTRLSAVVLDHAVEGALVISTLAVGEHRLTVSQTNTGVLPLPGSAVTLGLDSADVRVF